MPTTNLSVVTTESAQAVIKSLKSSLSQQVKLINTKAKKGTQRYKEIPEKSLKNISKKNIGLRIEVKRERVRNKLRERTSGGRHRERERYREVATLKTFSINLENVFSNL